MKKLNYVFIVYSLFFLTLLSISTTSQAWSNGKTYTGGRIDDPIYIQLYNNDYTNYISGIRNEYYGTHDWIAETALELLYLYNPSNLFITKLRNNEDYMKIYYLVGTEFPDRQKGTFELMTRCGFVIENPETSASPHIRWDPITKLPLRDKLGPGTHEMYLQALEAFLAKDCQRAAFYLGAMMHYIGDASYYGHTIDGTKFMEIFKHVDYVTGAPWNFRTQLDFFLTDEVKARLLAFNDPEKFLVQPQAAAWIVAQDTFFGEGFYEDALFLLLHEPSKYDRKFWFDIDGFWNSYQQELSWTYLDRPIGGDAGIYFDTLEHNLNMAILYGYAALNYAITYGGYNGCDCLGDPDLRYPEPNPNPPVPQGQGISVQTAVNRYFSLFFFNSVGLIATVVALAIVPKSIEALEKMLRIIPF